MKLFYHRSGQGRPLFILHGLFGSWENLGSTVKTLAANWDLIAPDIRNHGRSPHSDDCSYRAMAADIIELADELGLEKFCVLGHSMGGKIAMELTLTHPERIDKLIVVDIAPVQYPNHHANVFAGLRSIDLSAIKSRSDADQQLQQSVSEASVRAFLLKNLSKNAQGKFEWRLNLEGLEKNYAKIAEPVKEGCYLGSVLFIKGALSDYLLPEHQAEVVKRFPKASLKVIEQVGHWPHAEKPHLFIKLVQKFLET